MNPLIPDVLGKTPGLDDYEGTWDDISGLDRDDTFDDLDALTEEGFQYGEGDC